MRSLLISQDEFRFRIKSKSLSTNKIREECQACEIKEVSIEVTSCGYIVATCDPASFAMLQLIFDGEIIDD